MTSAVLSGRDRFKQPLRKVGSGEHTSKGMSREEAADAMELMLQGEATPAQIGAFLIAHRIRRPEPQELTGMLDTYRAHGPVLQSTAGSRAPLCFGMPYDGRTRTAPIYPLTALVLLACGQPVVLQGGDRMPIKYGVTAVDLFRLLDLNLTGLPISAVADGFQQNGFALIHQPDHFPIAETLIGYREELGKRPPVASLELLWTPHQGDHLLVSGFVHPPTEVRAWLFMGDHTEDNNLEVIENILSEGWDVVLIDSMAEVQNAVVDTHKGWMSSKKAETELLNVFEKHNLGQNDSNTNTSFLVIQQVTKGGEFAGSNRFKHMMTGMAHMKWTKEGDRTFFFSKNRRGGDMSVRMFSLNSPKRVGWLGTLAAGE